METWLFSDVHTVKMSLGIYEWVGTDEDGIKFPKFSENRSKCEV